MPCGPRPRGARKCRLCVSSQSSPVTAISWGRFVPKSTSTQPPRLDPLHLPRLSRGPEHQETGMGFKTGIVGLPNVGKSTLFNALTRTAAAQAANFPFCTIEPNVGEVNVPDPRLEVIMRIGGSAREVPTRMTFVDIAGLVRGAAKGEGLGKDRK